MKYRIVSEGFVTQRQPGTAFSVAAGSRCVSLGDGKLICSFMGQAKIGLNDFKPMLTRSQDHGATWTEPRIIWPELQEQLSIFGSVSISPKGEIYFYGMGTPIDRHGELAWSEATQGLKQNELVWSRSRDAGNTWEPLKRIPMPIPGSAEAAGAMCVTRAGDFIACYAPYNTFDPALKVDKNQVVCVASRDEGRTWSHNSMFRFPQPEALGAESWVIELKDGRLLGTGWHICGDQSMSNAYAISRDSGRSWSPTLATGTFGQSTGLGALSDGRAAFVYNQRKHGTIGVWLAIADPTERDFGLVANEPVWQAETAVKGDASGDFKDWTSFAFGEPSATELPDGTILVTFWVAQPSGHGIRYVKVRRE